MTLQEQVAEFAKSLGEADGFMVAHYRAFGSSTCYFGPFADVDETCAWLEKHPDVSGSIIPLYRTVDWNRV